MIRAMTVLALVGSVAILSAQAPTPLPAFEVASVRANTSGDARFSIAWPKGSFSATNVQLRMLIAQAYGIPGQFLMRFKVVGGPEELLAERYDVQARLPDSAPEGQHFDMLRSLLNERFKLRARYETRPTPIYALSVARQDRRLGPDLRRSAIDCIAERERVRQGGRPFTAETAPRDAQGRPVCWGTSPAGTPGAQALISVGPLSDLVRGIQAVVDRPVTDDTGLAGTFEWHLVFASPVQGNPDVPSVFTAVQEQLGLKLEARTGPYELLVIESVERPTPD